MKNNFLVTPSALVESILPTYVIENYSRFVDFMKDVSVSTERIGFGQHLISNLSRYRDFSIFSENIVSQSTLKIDVEDFADTPTPITWTNLLRTYNPNPNSIWKLISIEVNEQQDTPPEKRIFAPKNPTGDAEEGDLIIRNFSNTEFINIGSFENQIITLTDGFGFPEKDGIILIDDEIILYGMRIDNVLYSIRRASSAATTLSTFTSAGVFKNSSIARHSAGTPVLNLSVLFLSSILNNIYDSFASGIAYEKVDSRINSKLLLTHIRDFFSSKGTKLGITSLFKIIFGNNEVDVSYPGDLMIVPSVSTWAKDFICTSIPILPSFYERDEIIGNPSGLAGSQVQLRSYSDDQIYANCNIEYVNLTTGDESDIYSMVIAQNEFSGNFLANPITKLVLPISKESTTITVNSTLGFSESGLLFIENECISYTSKSLNQFYGCFRGKKGIYSSHSVNSSVFGPYYLFGTYTFIDKNGNSKVATSRSWPTGLLNSIRVDDGGILHSKDDKITIQPPGSVDLRSEVLNSYRKRENTSGTLTSIIGSYISPEITQFTNGVTRVFFDENVVYVVSNNFPLASIGPFTTNMRDLKAVNAVHLISRKIKSNLNLITSKGTDEIGVTVTGVPLFSNVLKNPLYSGVIRRFIVKNGGEGYAPVSMSGPTIQTSGPVVIISPNYDATAIPTVINGRITEVNLLIPNSSTYTTPPTVTISSGDSARFNLIFDSFGRLTKVTVSESRNYLNAPKLEVIDSSGRGRGAAIDCNVLGGAITEVNIRNPGIDYFAATTYIQTIPIGQNAVVEAKIDEFSINLVDWVRFNSPNYLFDGGNGYLFSDNKNVNSRYGFPCDPILERKALKDDGSFHSPIIGWAYDGNPIYGPYGYVNSHSGAVVQQTSSYRLLPDRSSFIQQKNIYRILLHSDNRYYAQVQATGVKYLIHGSYGGLYPGIWGAWEFVGAERVGGVNQIILKHPANHLHIGICDSNWDIQYFYGWFYLWSPQGYLQEINFSTDFNGDGIIGMPGQLTPSETTYPMGYFVEDYVFERGKGTLDEFNGKITNTPEFPIETYPNGVYCYFITIDSALNPAFPYIIGPTFKNLPLVQDISRLGISSSNPVYNPYAFGNENYKFDFNLLNRNKIENGVDPSNNHSIIAKVTGISSGSLSEIFVQDSAKINSTIGDFVSFDNSNTSGGGAQAKVSVLNGACIESVHSCTIETRLISHRQVFNFSSAPNGGSLFFLKGSIISARGNNLSEAIAIVEDWNGTNSSLIVRTQTINLIQPGQIVLDSLGQSVVIPNSTATSLLKKSKIVFGSKTQPPSEVEQNLNIVSYLQPTERYDKSKLAPGDLWWSIETGRLYIYYMDSNSSQWVVAQPYGVTPLGHLASDSSIGVTGSNFVPTPGGVPPSGSSITISDTAPAGGNFRIGDMWWSPVTGILYIWNSDPTGCISCACDDGKEIVLSTNEWICTDPSGSVSKFDPSINQPPLLPRKKKTSTFTVTNKVNVTVSDSAPPDKNTNGDLWWSSYTGKLHIRYINRNGSNNIDTWVVTNPIGSTLPRGWPPPTPGAPGAPPTAPAPPIISNFGVLPELSTTSQLFFEKICDFYVGDNVSLVFTSGDTESSSVLAKFSEKRGDALFLFRSSEASELPNNTLLRNESKFKITFFTKIPHRLLVGDIIQLKTPVSELANRDFEIVDAGYLDPAIGRVIVNGNKTINRVEIIYPGNYYRQSFYVTFVDGYGTGASAFAIVSKGKVVSVELQNYGQGYSSGTQVDFQSNCSWKMFSIYVDKYYNDTGITNYVTTSRTASGSPAELKLLSGGLGYTSLPKIRGIYKKESDRAQVDITLSGTSISSINVIPNRNGRRYTNPLVFIWDSNGAGKNATATANVVDGQIVSVNVTNGGIDYDSPEIIFYEVGKFIPKTTNIGAIRSFGVVNSGKNILNDNSFRPMIDVQTTLIISHTVPNECYPANLPVNDWNNAKKVYQGLVNKKEVIADVVKWNPENQTLTVKNTIGRFKEGQEIKDFDNLRKGTVISSGQSTQTSIVKGYSIPIGYFITDKSFIGSPLSYIQDSYLYQLFSYVIRSSLPLSQYESIVNEVVHPAGFIYFSELLMGNDMKMKSDLEEFNFSETIDVNLSP